MSVNYRIDGIPVAFDAVRIIQDELNDEIFTGVGFMGSFTTAANLAGTTTVLKAMRKDPEGLHKLLDFAADATIEVGRKFYRKSDWNRSCRANTIAPGCDIPVQAPLENIDAYMRAARQCAKYPVQPANWE